MQESLYQQLIEIEDDHWWFSYRQYLVLDFIRKQTSNRNLKTLDLGAGTGGNIRFLKKYFTDIRGLERSQTAIDISKTKLTPKIFNGDLNDLALFGKQNGRFDLITLFNVLYHKSIADPEKTVSEIRNLLNPGGILVFTEPAFNILMRSHDKIGHGDKRFKIKEAEAWLRNTGFENIQSSYFNLPSFFPALGLSIFEKIKPKKTNHSSNTVGELETNSILNQSMKTVMNLERGWINSIGKLPFGVTLIAAGRIPS